MGDVVKETMSKNEIEDEIKRYVIIHGLDETDINNFDDRMKSDMNKLSEPLEDGIKIQMPEISKIKRVGKDQSDNRAKQ